MVSNQAQNRPSIGFLDDGKKKKTKQKNPTSSGTVAFCAVLLGREPPVC